MEINDEVILRPRKFKIFLYLMLCSIFTTLGILMIADGRLMGWFGSLFFGIGIVVFVLQLLPGSSYLLLNKDGFIVCSLFRASSLKWSDIEEFSVGFIGFKTVVFNFSPSYNRQQKARIVSRAIAGYEGALPDTYGKTAEELADLMNEWKAGIKHFV